MNVITNELKTFFFEHLPAIEDFIDREVRDMDPLVSPLAAHVLKSGGKRLRPMLCITVARALGYTQEAIYPLAGALEFVHSATLLHDDILDGAELRRGRVSTHLVFGKTEAILAGDALLARANRIITSYGILKLVVCVSEAIEQTASGEILEIARMKQPVLSREEYLEIITGKTAYLMQACAQCGAVLAGANEEQQEAARKFGANVGIAFQLVDDALDYSACSESSGKPRGGDLQEGKVTLPLIFFLETLPGEERQDLLTKIKNGQLTDDERKWILEKINSSNWTLQTREEADMYLQKAKEMLDFFPNTYESGLLESILEYIKERGN
jgi:octaprenyl-diphosphate synthase